MSGEWAAGWGPHCPGEGMVSGRGPVGCPAAQPKPGGWGAVVAEEVQMTWLTWREMGSSQGLVPGTAGPRMHLHAHVEEHATCGSLAEKCRLRLTQPGGHVPTNTLARAARSSTSPGFCSSHGPPHHSCAQKCHLIPMTTCPAHTWGHFVKGRKEPGKGAGGQATPPT